MLKLVKTLVLVALVFVGGIFAINYATGPLDSTNNQKTAVLIPQNTSVIKIGEILEKSKIIRNKYFFKYYVRYQNLDSKLKAGTYNLSPSMSLADLTELLQKGEQVRVMFTVPEGFTVKQIAKLLADKGIVDYDSFLAATKTEKFNYSFLNYNAQLNNPLEGFLFPDTYYIPKGFSEKAIINMMLKRFDEVFDEGMKDKTAKLHLSVQQIVTMASLVEKEAKLAEERPVIAGVFYNRINKKMRLESCATIQYLLGKAKPVLYYDDLKIESPYNTYKNSGLPPGPIANPGKASLIAAVSPKKTSYLYFVAKENGSHYFSKTLAEHNRAKRKYLP